MRMELAGVLLRKSSPIRIEVRVCVKFLLDILEDCETIRLDLCCPVDKNFMEERGFWLKRTPSSRSESRKATGNLQIKHKKGRYLLPRLARVLFCFMIMTLSRYFLM